MKRPQFWVNGKFVDADKAAVSVTDRGFLYGDGLFETMRAYSGRVFMLDEHIDRLFRSLKTIRIKPPYTRSYISRKVKESVKRNMLDSAYIRLTVTRGEGKFGIDTSPMLRPNTVIVSKALDAYPDKVYEEGVRLYITGATRQNEYSPVSKIKSLNFLNYILARIDARSRGADEAVILNTRGFVAEGSASNIFIVKKGAIITPSVDSGILPGVTREAVIKIARKLGLCVSQRPLRPAELFSADEVFITSSIAEVMPVTRIGRKKAGRGVPGGVTKELLRCYRRYITEKG